MLGVWSFGTWYVWRSMAPETGKVIVILALVAIIALFSWVLVVHITRLFRAVRDGVVGRVTVLDIAQRPRFQRPASDGISELRNVRFLVEVPERSSFESSLAAALPAAERGSVFLALVAPREDRILRLLWPDADRDNP
jgi:predicted signal transduction protein with EAL and GGDEF domain